MSLVPVRIKIKYRTPQTKRMEQIAVGNWIDLAADEDIVMEAGQVRRINLGVAMHLPDGYEAQIAPRSSTYSRYHIIQSNSIAVIDTSFCGDDDFWLFSALAMHDTFIPRGTRICQFRIIERQPRIIFDEVDQLGNPNRGGFGTTGR